MQPSWELENELVASGHEVIAGVDEAGRGALAGPVVVAAVVLPRNFEAKVNDSKQLSHRTREQLASAIRANALAYHVALADVQLISEKNVLGATLHAANEALTVLQRRVGITAAVTDYLRVPTELAISAPPKADRRSVQVAAASIIAKVVRDAYMRRLDARYPGFSFARHKGYTAPAHVQALSTFGPCPEHRLGFAPVQKAVHEKRLFP